MKKKLLIAIALLGLVAASSVQPSVGLYWTSNADPTAGGGVAAPMWQLLIRTDAPGIYYKSGTGNTAWTAIGGASAGATVTTSAPATGNGTGGSPISVRTFGTAQSGVVPASGGGTQNYLRADGTWTTTPSVKTGWFGSGVDGDCNFTGGAVLGISPTAPQIPNTYVLNRDIYCTTIEIGSIYTVDPNGWRIFATGAVQLDGNIWFIANNGQNGFGNGTGGAGGAQKAIASYLSMGGVQSRAGGPGGGSGALGGGSGNALNNPRPCVGQGIINFGTTPATCQGGPGGLRDNGATNCGPAGATSLISDTTGGNLSDLSQGTTMIAANFSTPLQIGTGGGGGCGGSPAGCGGGGGGGASGGPVVVVAYGPFSGAGQIIAKGADGGPGPTSGCTGCGATCQSSGGGGGAGGFLVLIYGVGNAPSFTVAGGAGGAGSPNNPATNHGRGADGASGVAIVQQVGA